MHACVPRVRFPGRAEGGVGSRRVIDRSELPCGWVLGTESEIAPQPEAWLSSHGCGNLSYFPVFYKMGGDDNIDLSKSRCHTNVSNETYVNGVRKVPGTGRHMSCYVGYQGASHNWQTHVVGATPLSVGSRFYTRVTEYPPQ